MDPDTDPTGGPDSAEAISAGFEPPPGSGEAIAIRLVTGPGEGSADVDPVDLLDTPDPLSSDIAEALSDVSDRAGPDEDDAEAWFDEVQGGEV